MRCKSEDGLLTVELIKSLRMEGGPSLGIASGGNSPLILRIQTLLKKIPCSL